MITQELFKLFKLGVDYGQLLMEEERDSEDWADAFQGHIIDTIYQMPSQVAPRRKPHSEAWRQTKLDSLHKAMEMIGAKINKD